MMYLLIPLFLGMSVERLRVYAPGSEGAQPRGAHGGRMQSRLPIHMHFLKIRICALVKGITEAVGRQVVARDGIREYVPSTAASAS